MTLTAAYPPTATEALQPLMLRLNALKVGDVILTHGPEKFSRVISHLSGGDFSHAALCTATNIVFESDGALIRHTVIEGLGWWKTAAGEALLGRLPSGCMRCAVYRHPNFVDVSPKRFSQTLQAEMLESFGKDYSELYRLLNLASMSGWARRLLESCLRLHHDWRLKDNIPGPFCSELVAKLFEGLELGLFPVGRPPSKVSPNDLTNSILIKVDDVVVTPVDVLGALGPLPATQDEDKMQNRLSEAFASDMNAERRIGRMLKSVADTARPANNLPSIQEVVSGSLERLIAQISVYLDERKDTWDLRSTRRAQRLASLSLGLVADWPRLLSSESDGECSNAFLALGVIRRSFLRCVALRALEERKTLRRNEGFWVRRKVNRRRRELVESWRFAKRTMHWAESEWSETHKVAERIQAIGKSLIESHTLTEAETGHS